MAASVIRYFAITSILALLLSIPAYAQQTTEYGVVIDARGKLITGICVMEELPSGQIVGAVVNEMGFKAFDFVYDGKKVKLHNVFRPINKWYIRKILRKDMAFLFANIHTGQPLAERGWSITFPKEGEVELTNEKYHITYIFSALKQAQ